LAYFADLYNVEERAKKLRIEELLDLVGLTEQADKVVVQYSKGLKQRLQIARGLINQPQYIFMDEPTIGLDAPIAREIRRIVKERLNKTILFTSHYMEEVEDLCDEIAILHKGRVVEQGTVSQLKRRYKKGFSLAIVIDKTDDAIEQVLQSFRQNRQASISTETTEEGYRISAHSESNITSELVDTLTMNNCRIIELRAIEPRLEDVLITISGREAIN
jgi:ABC-2 type transport system ATP-binding protein